jgi:hypothetical protein
MSRKDFTKYTVNQLEGKYPVARAIFRKPKPTDINFEAETPRETNSVGRMPGGRL